jgi:mono/diheme cytochrome c family protein
MMISSRGLALAGALLTLIYAGPAAAQENLNRGKSGAQLYASDCAICHKSPQGLSKPGGFLGLESFLRQHYTASRQAAASITAYLNGIDRGTPAAPPRARAAKKPRREEKPGDKKTEAKPSDAKPSDAKPAASGKSNKPL